MNRLRKWKGELGIYALLICLSFLIVACIPEEFYTVSPYRRATGYELGVFYKAIETNNVSICYTFDPRAELKATRSTLGFYLRDQCFFDIAVKTKNPKLCTGIEYLGDARVTEYVDDKGRLIVTTLGQFETYKASCIEESNRTW